MAFFVNIVKTIYKCICISLDILVPRFITEEVCLCKDEEDYWVIVSTLAFAEEGTYTHTGTVNSFNLFEWGLRPKLYIESIKEAS